MIVHLAAPCFVVPASVAGILVLWINPAMTQ
jgi:hypothetical protein